MAICPSICRVPGIHSLSAGGCLLLISPIPTTNTVPPCRGFSCLRHGALLYQAIVGLLFLFGKLSAHGPQPIQCGGGKGGVHDQAKQLVPGGDKVICPAGQGAGGVQGNALRSKGQAHGLVFIGAAGIQPQCHDLGARQGVHIGAVCQHFGEDAAVLAVGLPRFVV